MPARDKYTVYSANAKGYRKGIHKVPKWTRVRSPLPNEGYLTQFLRPVDTTHESQRFLSSIPSFMSAVHQLVFKINYPIVIIQWSD